MFQAHQIAPHALQILLLHLHSGSTDTAPNQYGTRFWDLNCREKNIWERTLKRQGNLRIKAAKRPGGETTNSNVFSPTAVTIGFQSLGPREWCVVFAEPENRNTTTTLEPWNLGICGHQLNGLVAKSEGDHGFPHQIHCKFP